MPFHIVSLVGVAQIVSIGSLFYAYPVLAGAISVELGYPVSWLFGLLTAAILLCGLVSPWIGRMIDRRGAYVIIVWGAVLSAASLTALGASTGLASLATALLAVQIASNMTLYEAVFPALMQIDEARARRLVSQIALFGGLTSTVFWPLTQFMLDAFGWRETLYALAIGNLLFCTPVYALALRKAKPLPVRETAQKDDPPAAAGSTRRPMVYMTLAICLVSFSQQAINYGLFPAMIAHGMEATDVAIIGALLGPCTVVARIIDVAFGGRVKQLHGTIASAGLLTLALFIPSLAPAGSHLGFIAFMVVFGVGQGIFTITRSTLPLAYFGPDGYGARLGIINAWRRYLIAASPFLFAFAIEAVGSSAAFALLALVSLAGFLLFFLLRRNEGRS